MELRLEDYRLLLALQQDPDATDVKIAKSLEVAPRTIARWINRLREDRVIYRISALPDWKKIGLSISSFLIAVPPQHMDLIQELCDLPIITRRSPVHRNHQSSRLS